MGEYQPGWFGFGKFKPGLKPHRPVLTLIALTE
jgi:hypothetical protein